jgi:hypothetical protein
MSDLRRDTSEWDKGRLQQYQEQNLVGRPWGGAGEVEPGTPGDIHPALMAGIMGLVDPSEVFLFPWSMALDKSILLDQE